MKRLTYTSASLLSVVDSKKFKNHSKSVLLAIVSFVYLSLFFKIRALSSVGLEHLVYTEGVGGSNPSAPTLFRLSLKTFYTF